jgi:hypothetical protein
LFRQLRKRWCVQILVHVRKCTCTLFQKRTAAGGLGACRPLVLFQRRCNPFGNAGASFGPVVSFTCQLSSCMVRGPIRPLPVRRFLNLNRATPVRGTSVGARAIFGRPIDHRRLTTVFREKSIAQPTKTPVFGLFGVVYKRGPSLLIFIPFSAFWLRSSVVSVLNILINILRLI